MRKSVNFIKKHGLAVFAMTLLLGYGGFSYAKSMFATNWYLIQNQGPNPDDDTIGAVTMDPSQGGDCEKKTHPERCAIQLQNNNNFNLDGVQVSAAKALPGVSELDRTNYKP
ncbi:hypothetical protein QE382_003821 [Sphingobacterium zeae]|uniref:Uncharacterized protein n=1 Tax=Sphingobacterium zeae TaxID=1776859 RepID=A0ABU0UAD1_9SPHI|nr:hypothetical protein [Sphingobacterium zeae]MDQ1151837.1 hypothetical protein [Sphingobacterium zeae]